METEKQTQQEGCVSAVYGLGELGAQSEQNRNHDFVSDFGSSAVDFDSDLHQWI